MEMCLRMAAASAHSDCNITPDPQEACISPCHQLNNIYRALGAFRLCLPRTSLAALQSCSLFLAGSLSALHFVAGKCQLSVLVLFPTYRLPSLLLLIYRSALVTTAAPGNLQSVQRITSITDANLNSPEISMPI